MPEPEYEHKLENISTRTLANGTTESNTLITKRASEGWEVVDIMHSTNTVPGFDYIFDYNFVIHFKRPKPKK